MARCKQERPSSAAPRASRAVARPQASRDPLTPSRPCPLHAQYLHLTTRGPPACEAARNGGNWGRRFPRSDRWWQASSEAKRCTHLRVERDAHPVWVRPRPLQLIDLRLGVVSTCDKDRALGSRACEIRRPTQRAKPSTHARMGSSIGFGIALRSQISAWQSSLLRELAGLARVRKQRACQHRTARVGVAANGPGADVAGRVRCPSDRVHASLVSTELRDRQGRHAGCDKFRAVTATRERSTAR